MTLSSFHAMPCQGHMEHVKCIYGYLSKMKEAIICIWVEEPDLSGMPEQDFDWSNTVYGNVKEIIANDKPEPLGNCVTLLHYYDANLYHDLTTGCSVTGVLHLFNKTTIEWYSKKQATVETATYGSDSLLPEPVLIRLLIYIHIFITLEFQFVNTAMYLEITKLLLMVQLFHMPSYTNATMHCHSTVYVRL